MNYNECSLNYHSQLAYIEDSCISIDDYDNKYNGKEIKCINGHLLIFAKGEINKPYFRHKNNNDIGFHMTKWHYEWQEKFPITEISFPRINDNQIKDRRADVVIKEHNIVVEFQHSKIDINEVNNRKKDYELNNHRIIWIIDGNKTVSVKKLDYCNRSFLEFILENWKYKSFINYDYIFIDINNLIYKISPKNVKSEMIDVEQPFNKDDFINYLNHNNIQINNYELPLQCKLYIKQQGAGNGKTFGLIQMLESPEFEHYKYFIIVTKQHSAKYIIFTEFKNQINEGLLKNIVINREEEITKKYKISFTNKKTNKECQLVVGTIDSLMYAIGNKNHTELKMFEGLVNSIIDDYTETNYITTINYSGINIKLNKKKKVNLLGKKTRVYFNKKLK